MGRVSSTLERSEAGELDEQVAEELLAAVSSIRRSVRRRVAAPAELAALTGSQLELVRLVRRRPGISVADAAKELALASNTVSTLVGQLVQAGIVIRRVDTADRRVARLELVDAIRDAVTARRDRRIVILGEALRRLGPEERRRLARALPALARLADEVEASGATR